MRVQSWCDELSRKKRIRAGGDDDAHEELYDMYPDLLVVDSSDELANLVYHLNYTVNEKLAEKIVSYFH